MAATLVDDIFKCIFMNEEFCVSIRISSVFVPMGPIDNSTALVQVMVWHRKGNKPLHYFWMRQYIDDSVQDYSNPNALGMELQKFYTKPRYCLSQGPQLLAKISYKSSMWMRARISNDVYVNQWYAITHP